ncbi:C40 family peptidase [Stackebrandtia nassauensis]|uniref:NLP/P60 protein n=1 Tax=Stackebrandtia nassauensis (strain DSM 44728 / CIP 108903 / NRRL B-16338 / NBRC 102104 / LLR-40K-21) TaxID=446470 RepID=D3PV80_STANL|nr:C40 family peptidase [Stackebrandtia nassauensis]ADD41133.1 NLP/P60 protein [Stackebrandtia nassauensis DSM 44728]
MPAVYPESNGDSPSSRKLIRSLVGTGLTAAVIAIAVALPDQAAAKPSLEDKLKTVSSELKDAKSDLADLKERRSDVKGEARTAQAKLDEAPEAVTEAVAAVDDATSPIDRLSVLSGYGSSQTAELAEAVGDRAEAAEQTKRLSGDIDDLEDKVDDLTDKRDKLKNKLAEAASESGSGKSGDDSPSVSSDGAGAVAFAKAQLGDAYVFGSTGPDTWDCSSLTQAAWSAAGKSIGRDTYAQWDNMTHIDRADLSPGDLVFYNSQGHVAMYVGGGKVIHAPQEGETVKYSPIDMMPIDGYTTPS